MAQRQIVDEGLGTCRVHGRRTLMRLIPSKLMSVMRATYAG